MTIIDTHTHFHDPQAAGDLLWPSPGDAHYRTCLPATYRAEVGTRPVVAIETSPRRKDDLRLMRLAASDPLICAYVSNLQPLEPGFEARLTEAKQDAKWRGLRLRPIAAFDLAAPGLLAALDRLDGHGHVELGLQHADSLAALRALCLALPHIRFVLTHCARPAQAGAGSYDYRPFEGLENLYVKLSPPKEEDMAQAPVRVQLAGHVARLVGTLSPARLMFGSNWPVAPKPAAFEGWLAGVVSDAGGEVAQVYTHTAQDLYRP
ncbi:amidohydrolase family protein [Pseudoruegeria sp. SHC-113]|uniref:amidohydrolase family protein n=1 Tax=Pseudoruegeria sp. SHC-113 TaxID=2855439 RepID=UPI0021BB5EC0|nr:amidohydrolase family protein [Pseudoruegeria sp. SHC-113]MCT8162173.1 amidohydrolase family protein [Pseudoruegeria sp. SHC-113]